MIEHIPTTHIPNSVLPILTPLFVRITIATVSSSVGICKEIYLITVGLTEANVAIVLAGWLSK